MVEQHGSGFRCVACGCLALSPRLDLSVRLGQLADRIRALIDEHQPDCVAVEEAFHHESARSTLVLGHVRGAILVAAAQAGVKVVEYTPREIKLSVAGQGGAAKPQVEFMVRRILRLREEVAADVADALATALCHLHRSHRSATAVAARRAAARLAELLPAKARP